MNMGKMLSLLATACLLLSWTAAHPLFATEFNISSSSACTLADAIRSANKDEAVGSCGAGAAVDVIVVTSDITLSAELPTFRQASRTALSSHPSSRPWGAISGTHLVTSHPPATIKSPPRTPPTLSSPQGAP